MVKSNFGLLVLEHGPSPLLDQTFILTLEAKDLETILIFFCLTIYGFRSLIYHHLQQNIDIDLILPEHENLSSA